MLLIPMRQLTLGAFPNAFTKLVKLITGDLINTYCSFPFSLDIKEYIESNVPTTPQKLGEILYFLSLYNIRIVVIDTTIYIKFHKVNTTVKALIDNNKFQSDKTKQYYTDGKNYYYKIVKAKEDDFITIYELAVNTALEFINKLK